MVELFILQILLVYALPSAGALSTVSAPFGVVNVKAPEPTAPPKDWNQILRKDNVLLGGGGTIDVDDRVCGWVDADPENAFSCIEEHATCFWDTDRKLVGCGNQKSMPFVTSCIDFESSADCDSACAANPSIVVCASAAPYCRTVHFPESFSMLPCASVPSPLTVDITLSGLDGTITDLPRFYSSISNSTTTTKTKHEGVNTGSIIAAAVGGSVLLAGLPFGIKMFLRRRKWKRATRPRRLQEREMRRAWAGPETAPRDIYIRQEIPRATTGTNNFLFSQDWPGRANDRRSESRTQDVDQSNG